MREIEISKDELIRLSYDINSVYRKKNNNFFTLSELRFYSPWDTMHIYTTHKSHLSPRMYQITEINDHEIKAGIESKQRIKFFSIPFKNIEMIVFEKVIK